MNQYQWMLMDKYQILYLLQVRDLLLHQILDPYLYRQKKTNHRQKLVAIKKLKPTKLLKLSMLHPNSQDNLTVTLSVLPNKACQSPKEI